MNLLLMDPSHQMCDAFKRHFGGQNNVEIRCSRFEHLIGSFDCIVSPANSFGIMDGGADLAIRSYFGLELQMRVQGSIWREFGGEQPVGTCLMVETGDAACPWLAHCPTMAVPMDVTGSRNAYLAMLAALRGAESKGVRTLACPGLCTGAGRIAPAAAAQQMRFAYDCWREQPHPMDWDYATARYLLKAGDTTT